MDENLKKLADEDLDKIAGGLSDAEKAAIMAEKNAAWNAGMSSKQFIELLISKGYSNEAVSYGIAIWVNRIS